MPVTLDDDLATHLLRALMSKPPVSGHIIIQMLDQQMKLLLQLAANQAALTEKVNTMSDNQTQTDKDFQAEFAAFSADVAKQTTVANGLKVAFAGLTQQIADLIAARQNAGASAEELAGLQSLHATVNSNTGLIDSVTQGTAAASEPPAPVVPPTSVDLPADPAADTSGSATA